MSKLNQLGQNNPLWRRVQRHAQMSAIFAPAVATAVSQPPTFAPAQPVNVVEFKPWEAPTTAVPTNQPANPVAPPTQPILQRANAPATAVPPSQPTSTVAPPPQPILQRANAPATAVPPSQPTSPVASPPQLILQLAEASATAVPPSQPTSTVAPPPQPTPQQVDAPATAVPATPPPPTNIVMAKPIQPKPEATPTAVPNPQPTPTNKAADSEKTEDEANWRRLQTIMQRHRQKQVSEQASAETTHTVQRETKAAAESSKIMPPAPNKTTATTNPAPQDENPTPAVQSVPLEAAWPVQEKSGQTPPATPVKPQLTSQPQVVQRASLPEEEATQINQNLAQIAPGRQTQSPIETIMPSRPRPQPKSSAQVQRQPAKETFETGEDTQNLQKEAGTAVPPTPRPKLIQTEIGPLPADLWETLGQQPPETPAADKPATATTPTETTVLEAQKTAAPQPADITRLERTLPEPQPETPATHSAEKKEVTATAIPTTPPSPTNIVMAKPIQPKPESTPTAVSPPNSSLDLPATPPPASAQPTGEVQGQIQRQAAKTAVPIPWATPPGSEAGESKVNVEKNFTTEAETASQETTHQTHNTAISPTPARPVAEPAASTTTLIAAKPIQRSKAVSQAAATAAAIPPGSLIRPISSETKTDTQAAFTATKPNSQPAAIRSETVIQRLPDLPAAMKPVMEAVSPNLAEMMPEEATAVLDEISPTETEEEPASQENLDIDALSRQVYQQLKRKLAVEWERGYGR